MSAAVLREAAALMRERAGIACASTDQGWRVRGYTIVGNGAKIASVHGGEGHDSARHIASWHPAVALAVADWLDGVAERHGPVDNAWNVGQPCCQTCNLDLEGDERGHCDDLDDALAVATAYLGGRP